MRGWRSFKPIRTTWRGRCAFSGPLGLQLLCVAQQEVLRARRESGKRKAALVRGRQCVTILLAVFVRCFKRTSCSIVTEELEKVEPWRDAYDVAVTCSPSHHHQESQLLHLLHPLPFLLIWTDLTPVPSSALAGARFCNFARKSKFCHAQNTCSPSRQPDGLFTTCPPGLGSDMQKMNGLWQSP